jgi:hypothetical protein
MRDSDGNPLYKGEVVPDSRLTPVVRAALDDRSPVWIDDKCREG